MAELSTIGSAPVGMDVEDSDYEASPARKGSRGRPRFTEGDDSDYDSSPVGGRQDHADDSDYEGDSTRDLEAECADRAAATVGWERELPSDLEGDDSDCECCDARAPSPAPSTATDVSEPGSDLEADSELVAIDEAAVTRRGTRASAAAAEEAFDIMETPVNGLQWQDVNFPLYSDRRFDHLARAPPRAPVPVPVPPPAPEPEPEPEPAPAPAPGLSDMTVELLEQCIAKLRNPDAARSSKSLRFRDLPESDPMLEAHEGDCTYAKIASFVKVHAPESEELLGWILFKALVLVTERHNNLRTFLEYVRTAKWFNVLGHLCEDVVEWEVTRDNQKSVKACLVEIYNTLKRIAGNAL